MSCAKGLGFTAALQCRLTELKQEQQRHKPAQREQAAYKPASRATAAPSSASPFGAGALQGPARADSSHRALTTGVDAGGGQPSSKYAWELQDLHLRMAAAIAQIRWELCLRTYSTASYRTAFSGDALVKLPRQAQTLDGSTLACKTPAFDLLMTQAADCMTTLLQGIMMNLDYTKHHSLSHFSRRMAMDHTGSWRLTRQRWLVIWSRHVWGEKRFLGQPCARGRALARLLGLQLPTMRSLLRNEPDPRPAAGRTDASQEAGRWARQPR